MIRIFKHYVPTALLYLCLIEAVIFVVATYLGALLRFVEQGLVMSEDVGPLLPRAIVFLLVMMGCMTAMGLYQRHLLHGLRGMFIRIGMSFLVGFVVMSLLFYLFPQLLLGRGAFGLMLSIAVTGIIIARLVYVRVVDQDAIKRRILVLGAGDKAALIDQLLKRKADRRGFLIVGYVQIGNEKVAVKSDAVLLHELPLVDIANKYDVDELVVAVTDRRVAFPVDEILDCKMEGVDVVELLAFFERQYGKIILDILQPSWLIYSDGFGKSVMRSVAKRVFDVLASVMLLSMTLPIVLITAIAIYVNDRGPVFYKQVRVGKNWRLFEVLKFRSMRVDAEKDDTPQFADKEDSRVTRVGKIIRMLRIDELPQLINVLRGDMSFVGPRPERPAFVEEFSEDIPYYAERHRVKPGITGWAQISYPYGASKNDTIHKLQYDLYYVKNYSLFFDLMILFLTAEVVLWGKGAR